MSDKGFNKMRDTVIDIEVKTQGTCNLKLRWYGLPDLHLPAYLSGFSA